MAQTILEPEDMPQFNNAKVAVFTQNTVNVVDGHQVADGIITHTLWGELAWQLGGREAYEIVRNDDTQMIAPNAQKFKTILEKASPALILIDELADYCNKASGKIVGSGTLFTQTNSFIQALTEVVSSVPKTVLICTLPASAREVASSEIGQEILSSLETRVIRVGSSVKPVDDEEIFEVVRRRLFDKMQKPEVIEQVARKYKDMYHNRRDALPLEADRVAYVERIKKAYPFHPELIDIFRVRWGSDSRFQRTRGVLRLLASIVKDLWQRRSTLVGTQALIQTSDVQLENLPTLQSTITSLMGAQWDSVMHADVFGTISNAYKLDEQNAGNNIGKYRLATAVTTTILMASVGSSSQKISLKQLKLCLLKPDAFQHIDIDSTVNQLENIVHYMYRSSIGEEQNFWFQAKPNINILINQAKGDVKDDEIYGEVLQMMKQSVTSITKVKVLVDPSGDVPEQKQLTFVVMHPKYTVAAGGCVSRSAEFAIKQMAQMKGSSQRVYRNTMLYLLCSEAGKAALSMKLREYLACDKIIKEYGGQLDPEQRKDVADRKKLSADAAKEQLIHAYNTVVKCVRDDLQTQEIVSFASDFASQITVNTLQELHENGWVLRRIGLNVINRNGLMPTVEKPVKVNDVYEAFLRFDDKPMILNVETITDTVNRYCEEGMWNVGTGAGEPYSRIYHNERVTFLNPQEDGYWLLDPSVMPKPAGGGGPTPVPPTPGPSPTPSPEPGPEPTPTSKTYKKLTISGSVPIENYSQLFSSFVNTLKNNHLKIEVKFTASNSSANPLTDNSPIVKSVKESASQLGLELEVEE